MHRKFGKKHEPFIFWCLGTSSILAKNSGLLVRIKLPVLVATLAPLFVTDDPHRQHNMFAPYKAQPQQTPNLP